MERRRQLLWSVIAIAIAAVTVWAVFSKSRTMTFAELFEILREADPKWLALSVLSMFGFIFFEGEAVLTLCRGLGYGRSHLRGLVYSAGDVYFSAITPSASGLVAMMLLGVFQSILLASAPTATTWLVPFSTATTDGSSITMPFPRT